MKGPGRLACGCFVILLLLPVSCRVFHSNEKVARYEEQSSTEVFGKAQAGDAYSQGILAEWYMDGTHGMSKDLDTAFHWASTAARQEHPFGFYHLLQLLYLQGESGGIEIVRERTMRRHALAQKALPGMKQLASDGDVRAQLYLGNLYYHGSGVERDRHEAVRWYRKAAEQGDGAAAVKIGIQYQMGYDSIGGAQDLLQAAEWYRKAADCGVGEAQWKLGAFYENGLLGTPDYEEAAKWYKRSLEKPGNESRIQESKLGYERCLSCMTNSGVPRMALHGE